MQPTSDKDPSFFRLLLRLLADVLRLALPFVIPFLLPFGLLWMYLVVVLLGQWIEDKLRGEVEVMWIWWLGACVGVSVALGQCADAMVSGVLIGSGSFAALLLLGRAWQKIAGLTIVRDDPGPTLTLTRIDGVERSRGRGRMDSAPTTPEGEPLRIIGCHEPRNSAPLQYDYLFPDGSVVLGVGTSTAYSPDGRYFISPMPTTGQWGLLIYDRHAQRVYRCTTVETFVELHAVTETHVNGWGSRVLKNGGMLSASIADLIAHSKAEPMVEIADLRLPQSYLEHVKQRQSVQRPPMPEGAPALELVAYLPARLMALADPLEPLLAPWQELIVDHQPSGLLVPQHLPKVIWQDDANTLVCIAKRKESDEPSMSWSWSAQRGWNAAPEERFPV
ncbi:hypothetical protein [Xanthomonas hortorum]|uniref:Uncharacterized protein n=1 Tax=Xanthomonas hortorum pv. hederae TaxID=453603 RepID=A0A9X4BW22_9XANT|nr:hypothetical protein [Xanthomonas hortorum]MCE4372540.1 hypothetical protein [Xanthomonas hortorum pv. hederae]MDC8640669.1 hypothetical protein [Xanthomonas hortorum pv. hederae]